MARRKKTRTAVDAVEAPETVAPATESAPAVPAASDRLASARAAQRGAPGNAKQQAYWQGVIDVLEGKV